MKKKCPCCGFCTIESDDEVITEICEVCYWQYDLVSQKYPDKNIGPNRISLNVARKNYKLYGACKKEYAEKGFVREPMNEEIPS